MGEFRAAALLVLACLAACSSGPARPPDVLLIVVDTLRADRLGAYGNRRGLTPTLDALAERAGVFRNALAASPWTSPSVASLFTARYPSQHGVVSYDSVLASTEQTLAEALRAQGYRTAGFSANSLLSAKRGFDQGFDSFRVFGLTKKNPRHMLVQWQKGRAKELNRAALAWLDENSGDTPVFLYLHYMEPHTPYSPPPAALTKLIGSRPAPDLDAVTDAQLSGRRQPVPPETMRDIQDVYDAEVASLDAAIEQLFRGLEKRRFLEDALVVFTADHGEEFMDHAKTGHGHTLYQELIRVPLLVRAPGQASPVEIDRAVSLVDVAPTILAWAGAEIPPRFEGCPLGAAPGNAGARADGSEGASAAAPIFSELLRPAGWPRPSPHERSIVLEDRKLILGIAGEIELYDLAADPGEQAPVTGNSPAAATLLDSLTRFAEHSAQSRALELTVPPEPEMREQLRALGYLE